MYKLYALPPMRPCSTEEVPLDTMVCIVGSIIPIRKEEMSGYQPEGQPDTIPKTEY